MDELKQLTCLKRLGLGSLYYVPLSFRMITTKVLMMMLIYNDQCNRERYDVSCQRSFRSTSRRTKARKLVAYTLLDQFLHMFQKILWRILLNESCRQCRTIAHTYCVTFTSTLTRIKSGVRRTSLGSSQSSYRSRTRQEIDCFSCFWGACLHATD
jgi:hypothetical protein